MCIQLNIENMKLTMSSSMSGIFDWLCSMFKGSIVVSIEFMYWNAQFWDEDKVYCEVEFQDIPRLSVYL